MRRIQMTVLAAVAFATMAATGCTYYEQPAGYTDDTYYEDDYYYEDDAGVVFDQFDELQYWGQWMDLYPYGEVWRPTVVIGWRPYSNGHWLWSDVGWTWVSYEPFGWITYHYGYWAYDTVWGWVWLPDYEWSPARVDWVVYDDYIAWAPLPPPGFRIGQPWNVTEVYVWHVVPATRFTEPDIGRHHVSYKANYRVQARSSVKYKAPPVDYVERRVGTTVRPVHIDFARRAERGDRTVKQMQLPATEAERVSRYREKIESRIRDADPPDRDDVRESDRRDRRERANRERDTRKERNTKPRKQEPVKKNTDRGSRDRDDGRDSGKDRDSGKVRDSDKDRDSGKDRGSERDSGERKPRKKKG